MVRWKQKVKEKKSFIIYCKWKDVKEDLYDNRLIASEIMFKARTNNLQEQDRKKQIHYVQ